MNLISNITLFLTIFLHICALALNTEKAEENIDRNDNSLQIYHQLGTPFSISPIFELGSYLRNNFIIHHDLGINELDLRTTARKIWGKIQYEKINKKLAKQEDGGFLYERNGKSITNYLKIINIPLPSATRKDWGKNVRIAIIDSNGFDRYGDCMNVISHRTKEDSLESVEGCDTHSTQVASIIAGVNGIAPSAEIDLSLSPSKPLHSWRG